MWLANKATKNLVFSNWFGYLVFITLHLIGRYKTTMRDTWWWISMWLIRVRSGKSPENVRGIVGIAISIAFIRTSSISESYQIFVIIPQSRWLSTKWLSSPNLTDSHMVHACLAIDLLKKFVHLLVKVKKNTLDMVDR